MEKLEKLVDIVADGIIWCFAQLAFLYRFFRFLFWGK